MLYLLYAERHAIDLEGRCHGVRRLFKYEVIQLPDVVFDPRLDIEPDPAHLLDQVLPVGFHGPPPAVAVRPWIVDVPDIVHQHAPEQDADRGRVKTERLCPLVPKLELHPDPVLSLRQAPLCRLVVNTNQNGALFTAMVDRNPRPSVIELLLNPGFPELTDKLLLTVLVIRIPEKPLDVQDTAVVVKGHIKPGHMEAAVPLEQLEKAVKVPRPVFLEGPAALAGHVQTTPHSRIAVIEDGDAAEVYPLPVSVPAMSQIIPAAALHAQQLHPGLRVLVLAAYRQPIIENDIL